VARTAEFHPEARAEFYAATDRYELLQPGLGAAFLAAVQAASKYALRCQSAGAPVSTELRRVFVRRFLYYLLYEADESRVFILAVAHFRRRPGYWSDRR